MARPNIIIVYTDQQRYDTLGANGNAAIRTPNLDRFADGGVNVSRNYVNCPVCVPSRIALHTGRYGRTTKRYHNNRLMPGAETTMPAHLRAAGYHTAIIGKDHCFDPVQRAANFDHISLASHCSIDEPATPEQAEVNRVRQGTMQQPWATDPVPPEHNITGTVCRRACDYVGERAGSDQPFFLWLSIPDPHPPYMVCEPYASMYDDTPMPPPAWTPDEMDGKPYRQRAVVDWNRYDQDYPGTEIDRLRRIYWGMVSYIDDEFQRLLNALDANGLRYDTIVIYTSDHGDYMGDHRMIRKGPNLYDCLSRVPFLAQWGDRFPARRSDALVCNVDIFPTLCDLADIEPPVGLQGVSQAPMLLGQVEHVRDAVYLEHGGPGRPLQSGELSDEEYADLRDSDGHHLCDTVYRGRSRAIVTGQWKYIFTAGGIDELYDLHADPHELTNIAALPQHAATVHTLRTRLLTWTIDTEDISDLA